MKQAPKKKVNRYDSEDSKRRLLAAALDTFSKEGYDAATTRAIAKLAGVNDSLIQRYFKGKLGLLFSLMKQFHTEHTTTALIEPAESLEKELENFFRMRLASSRRMKKFFKLVTARAIIDPKVRSEVQSYSRNVHPALKARLQTLKAEKRIRQDIDPELLARFLNSVAIGWAVFAEVIESTDAASTDRFISLGAKLIAQSLRP